MKKLRKIAQIARIFRPVGRHNNPKHEIFLFFRGEPKSNILFLEGDISVYSYDFCFQYDDHLSQLENNILLVQQRAMEQADMDTSWMGPEEENYTITEPEFRGVNNNFNEFGVSVYKITDHL